MLIAAFFLTALACFLAVSLIRRSRRGKSPPTPGWLPLLGSSPFVAEPLEEFLSQAKYAAEPVVALHYGLETLYVLNTHSAMKEAMVTQGDKYLARPGFIMLKELTGEWGGIIASSGEQWRDYRRFSLKTLRDFGFGRHGAEEIIAHEAAVLCETISQQPAGAALDTVPLFSTAISNVICQLVFGSRLASEDPEFERILQVFRRLTQSQSNRSLNMIVALHAKHMQALRPLARLALWLRRGRLDVFSELFAFCAKQADQHRAEMQRDGDMAQQPRDYIEAHLQHQASHPDKFNHARLTLAIADLFLAGTDTTSHTLRWAMLQMLRNPDVAEKVFQEIQTHIGTERPVTTKDKGALHYTMATLEEVQRLACLAPMGVMHCSTEESTVSGYRLPTGSAVAYNVYNIHHSADLFPEPDSFRPERHLDPDTGRFSPSEFVVPFGLGKRACLGESLARMELFLFFTGLMQRFRPRLDPEETRGLDELLTRVSSHGGGIRAPLEHRLVFESRLGTSA